MSVLSHHDEHENPLITATVNQTEGTVKRDPGLRLEIVDLINQQIVGAGDEFRVAPVADPLLGLLPRSDLSFGQLRLLASNSSA